MRTLCVKYVFAILIALNLFLPSSFAFYEPVITSTLGIEQGLSNSSVRCILQDHKGFMWFGTYDGLNRYDGYSFRIFRNKFNDANSLINNWINAIHEDPNGHIWSGTRKGVSIYNPLADRFSTLSYRAGKGNALEKLTDVIHDIKTDHEHNTLIGAENLGLLLCKKGETVARQVPLYSKGGKSTAFWVRTIIITENKAWVFVQNQGLCVLDYSSMTLRLVNATVKSAVSIALDGNDLWIGSSEGIFRYHVPSNTCIKALDVETKKLTSVRIVTLSMDKAHNLWIGTDGGGIIIWNPASGKMAYLEAGDSKSSLTNGAVSSIFEDRESRKWIGTLAGINIIDPQKRRFQVIAYDPAVPGGFSGQFVSCFYETSDGKLWIGTEDAGLNFWDRKKNSFIRFRSGDQGSLPSNTVTDIQGDDQNNLWIVTYKKGITRFQPGSGRAKHYQCINPAAGIENKVPYVLYYDRQRTLWVSTLREGNRYGALYFYNKAVDRFDVFDTNLSDLFCLNEDRQGSLWGGNLNQLVSIDLISKQHRFYPIGHPVRSIWEDKLGNLWLGTEGGGLILFDRKQKKVTARYATGEGLSNNSVLNILEDRQGNLWMSTFNGLSRFNPVSRTFINYYQSDGLQSNQFNYNAAMALRSGELVFGGNKGFSLFQPENIGSITNAPVVVITGIKVNEKPIGIHDSFVEKTNADEILELKVPFHQAVLSIDFAALEYSVPDKIQYSYYLEGWDRGWNYSGKLRTANYTHLTEGSYKFRVKSTNAEGIWSSREVTIRIIVLPPWYRTWWAYIFYMLLIGGAIILYLRYRAYKTKLKYEVVLANLSAEKSQAESLRQQAELDIARAEQEKGMAELERERAEREKKEAELAREQAERETERVLSEREKETNEKKLSFFTHVSHEFRTPLSLIINPIKDMMDRDKEKGVNPEPELPVVYRNARRLLSLVDQLLLFRKAESGMDQVKPVRLNICNFCKEVYLCFVQQAKAKNIDYHFECSNETLEIYADPQKLEIILYNLLSNALKYTPDAGSIRLEVLESEAAAEIVVADTGVGIPKAAGERLFEKFYQPERKNNAGKEGFGIGLYLVRHFTEQHHGAIAYQSEDGKGTTFTLHLPKGWEHFGPEVRFAETAPESYLLEGLKEVAEVEQMMVLEEVGQPMADVVTEKQTILLVDDDEQILQYLTRLFQDTYVVHQAARGDEGVKMAQKYLPDLIITDVHMQGISGIDLCKIIKGDPTLSHIPVILLTASSSDEVKLQGVEGGADDYITKPFDNKLLLARVTSLLKSRTTLQKYFYNEITFNHSNQKISPEYKQFLDRCIAVVENHLDDDQFGVKILVSEMGMSHSSLLRRVKSISGQPVNVFIRFIRLRKAAELFINTDYNVNETAFMVGMKDTRYFQKQFHKLFGLNPSEYIKKFRKIYGKQYTVDKDSINPEGT